MSVSVVVGKKSWLVQRSVVWWSVLVARLQNVSRRVRGRVWLYLRNSFGDGWATTCYARLVQYTVE